MIYDGVIKVCSTEVVVPFRVYDLDDALLYSDQPASKVPPPKSKTNQRAS